MNYHAVDAELLKTLSHTLLQAAGAGSELTQTELIREGPRSRVFRCRITGGTAPETVILKQITDEGPCGFTDWASLSFLSELPDVSSIVPRFRGGDVELRCFLMEDLGPSVTLEDVLRGDDGDAARSSFCALAVTYGRLHRSTCGREARFEEHRQRLPGAAGPGREREAERWLAGAGKLREWVTALGLKPAVELERTLAPIAALYAEPGAWLTFTHGDPAPSNNHVNGGQVRLLDFEYGAYRHALYDMTAWEVLCPLPPDLLSEMRRGYCGELARDGGPFEDEAEFDRHWATLCAYRAFALLTWIPPRALEANRSWVGEWSAREAVLAAVSAMARQAARHPPLAAVAELATTLESALRSRWPEYTDPRPRRPAL